MLTTTMGIFLLIVLLQTFAPTQEKEITINSDYLGRGVLGADNYGYDQRETSDEQDSDTDEKVKIKFFYETGCPYSKREYVGQLENIVKELAPYLDITTYPFGIARMKLKGSQLTISCQHGKRECYGNRLHACAIDALKEPVKYIPFNSCMIRYNITATSNDEAADACGVEFNIDSDKIKYCAKNLQGFQLQLNYGMESMEIFYPGVPWWYVNDVPEDAEDTRSLKETICAAFKNPPNNCRE